MLRELRKVGEFEGCAVGQIKMMGRSSFRRRWLGMVGGLTCTEAWFPSFSKAGSGRRRLNIFSQRARGEGSPCVRRRERCRVPLFLGRHMFVLCIPTPP